MGFNQPRCDKCCCTILGSSSQHQCDPKGVILMEYVRQIFSSASFNNNLAYRLDLTQPKAVAQYSCVQEADEDPDATESVKMVVRDHFCRFPCTVLVIVNPEIVYEDWKGRSKQHKKEKESK